MTNRYGRARGVLTLLGGAAVVPFAAGLLGPAAQGAVHGNSAGSNAAIMTTKTAGNSSTWVRWDKSTCKFVPAPASSHPRRYVAVLRKESTPFLLGYGTQNENAESLNLMNLNVENDAKKAGLKFTMVNYQYPSEPDAIAASATLALQHPKVIISYNVDTTIDPQMNSTFASSCIPVIKVSTPSTAANTVEFGSDNITVGRAEGKWLAQYVKKQGWTTASMEAFGVTIPSLAQINDRVYYCEFELKKLIPGLKTASEAITSSTTPLTESATAAWLTANPTVKHVLGCSISDINGVGYNEALESAGRASGSAIVGVGVEAIGLAAMGPGSAFKASVNQGYVVSGNVMVPMAEDIIAGDPVPTDVYSTAHVFSKV